MKKLSLSIVSLLFLSGAAFANCGKCGMEGKMHHEGGNPYLEQLTKNLSLTAEQQAAVKGILEEKRAQKEALHKQMMNLHADTMAKIEALLTPEQKKKMNPSGEMCEHHGKEKGKADACCPMKKK